MEARTHGLVYSSGRQAVKMGHQAQGSQAASPGAVQGFDGGGVGAASRR